MLENNKKILFASDLSLGMKTVFEHAVSLSAFCNTGIIVLHVMEEASAKSEKKVRVAFGETLYEKIKSDQKTGARNLLIGKNVDALRIRQAISGFLNEKKEDSEHHQDHSGIEKILVAEGRSIADEITGTAAEEDCGCIVMGSRRQGMLSAAMGDNLVKKVLKRSMVPVLVVPFEDDE